MSAVEPTQTGEQYSRASARPLPDRRRRDYDGAMLEWSRATGVAALAPPPAARVAA